jgi:ABC-2 type transport system ATP-binding protein
MNGSSSDMEPVVEIRGLTRRFGNKAALDNLSLTVPRGVVFGLVGGNGAGKTTLIKHVLGLLKAPGGCVRVFGMDPVAEPVAVLGRIGYLSELRDLPLWIRVGELLRYMRGFYPKWDDAYAEDLRAQFQLDPRAKVKNLSRGECAKAGLLVALAHRPELLVLDEPSSGLDPLVRRNILEAIVRTVAEQGRTVLFSSHLLDEVERVSDHLAMLVNGRLVMSGTLDAIQESHHRLTVRFAAPQSVPPSLPGALSIAGAGCEWTVVCNGALGQLRTAVEGLGGKIVEEAMPSLDEIFVARATGSPVQQKS